MFHCNMPTCRKVYKSIYWLNKHWKNKHAWYMTPNAEILSVKQDGGNVTVFYR